MALFLDGSPWDEIAQAVDLVGPLQTGWRGQGGLEVQDFGRRNRPK
jgi:hypothetical protein